MHMIKIISDIIIGHRYPKCIWKLQVATYPLVMGWSPYAKGYAQ